MVATQDEGSVYSRPAFPELQRLSGSKPISSNYRGSYVLVGYAGTPLPSWVKQEQRKSGKGPSVINAKIPLSGGGGGVTPPPPSTPPVPAGIKIMLIHFTLCQKFLCVYNGLDELLVK